MIIEVPVYIAIDQRGRPRSNHSPAAERSLVIRFDTDDDSAPIEWARQYGTVLGKFQPDTGDIFANAFSGHEWKRLIASAKANPVDYCADKAEGERLQEIADAAREQVS